MKTVRYCNYLLFLLLLVCSCQPADQAINNQEDNYSEDENNIHLEKRHLDEINIGVTTIQDKMIGEEIRINGHFDVPPQNKAVVSSFTDAFVKETSLLVGDKVKKGQVIVRLEHPDIITLQNELIERNQQLVYLKSDYERQQELDKNRINAKKNLIKAETEYKGMQAHVNALRQRVKMLGLDPHQVLAGRIYNQISLKSPINGYVTKVHIALGVMVKIGEPMFEIVDPDHLHIELRVFEKDIAYIKKDQLFTFSVAGRNQQHKGSIYLISKQLNEDRSIDIHGHPLVNRPEFLPGMYVDASLYADADSVAVLPESAILEDDQKYYVFLRKGLLDFVRKEIKTGKRSNGWVEVINPDFSSEEEIVNEGVYYLSSMNQSGGGHGH